MSAMTDSEIEALVAEKVAHVSPRKQMVAMNAEGTGMALWEDELTRRDDVIGFCKRHPEYRAIERNLSPPYLTDANAVLALLENEKAVHISNYGSQGVDWYVEIATKVCHQDEEHRAVTGTAPTFCRAACLALLRAHGVNLEGGK